MCKYYMKLFICGHFSKVLIERCRPACFPDAPSCTPDADTKHDPEVFNAGLRQDASPSHFACYDCLVAAAYAETTAKAATETDPTKRAALADSRARLASKQAKVEANRRAAEEKMRKEREEDAMRKEEVRREREKEMKGEGAWHMSGGQRKKKGKGKGVGMGMGIGMAMAMGMRKGSTEELKSAPPGVTTFMGVEGGGGGRANSSGEFAKDEPLSANEAHGTERGRVGPWQWPNGAKKGDSSKGANTSKGSDASKGSGASKGANSPK